jgi:hypothetical protein
MPEPAIAMAEPGVGKSRLYFEFKATSQSGWMVLETFSVSHGKASAYLPVIDLLRNYFRIASEDDERTSEYPCPPFGEPAPDRGAIALKFPDDRRFDQRAGAEPL